MNTNGPLHGGAMYKVTLRFYEELNDFLPPHRKKTDFDVSFEIKRSIKDLIESLGVPHTEIDLILVNGSSVDFNYIPKDNERISVYPSFESIDITHVTRLRKKPLRRTRFIADNNIGNIVRYMRALGFDVYYDPKLIGRDLVDAARKDKRIILTKSRNLLKFKGVTHGIFLRPGTTEQQIRSVVDYLDIRAEIREFSRCLCCNGILEAIPKETISERIPQKTRAFCHEYAYCSACDKIYWEGTHVNEMRKVLDRI